MSRLPNAKEAVATDRRVDDDPSGLKFIIEHERRDAEREERGRDPAEPVIDPSKGCIMISKREEEEEGGGGGGGGGRKKEENESEEEMEGERE